MEGEAYAMVGVTMSSSVSASVIRRTRKGRLMVTTTPCQMSVPTTTHSGVGGECVLQVAEEER
jgi:hypothetical protein